MARQASNLPWFLASVPCLQSLGVVNYGAIHYALDTRRFHIRIVSGITSVNYTDNSGEDSQKLRYW